MNTMEHVLKVENSDFRANVSWNIQGKLFTFNEPKLMFIVNSTPDSFYSQSRVTKNQLLSIVEKALQEGADIIDLGAYSTRPGAADISIEEEWNRLEPAISDITKAFPEALISIDTFRSSIAQRSIDHGAHIINDISGGTLDENMFETVGKLNVPYILMHLKGTPQTMQQHCEYKHMLREILDYFNLQLEKARAAGIRQIALDPGFGFAKNLNQNYELFNELNALHVFKTPLLVGVSRKSMIYKLLDISPEEALIGTSALHILALNKGAHILRVHDVKAADEVRSIWKQLHQ